MRTVSVFNNTNRVFSSSSDNWASLRPGSFVRIGRDNYCYTVAVTKPLMYIKDFVVLSPSQIKISDNVQANLMEYDEVKISYKEYELLTVIEPVQRGTNYKVNDIVYLDGGQPILEKVTNIKQVSSFRVVQVNEDGGILQIELKDKGKYVIPPPENCPVQGGSGSGSVFQAVFKVSDVREIIERSISAIQRELTESIVSLDVPLPENISEGKISVEKWEMVLTSNYVGETRINAPYEVGRDFTPHLGLPLLVKGSNTMETTVNQAFLALDERIYNLEQQVSKLTGK